jgi:hypothetical protein
MASDIYSLVNDRILAALEQGSSLGVALGMASFPQITIVGSNTGVSIS